MRKLLIIIISKKNIKKLKKGAVKNVYYQFMCDGTKYNMNKEYIRNNFNDWYKDIKNDTIIGLSDDMDSLLGTYILQERFGTKVQMFYSFSKLFFDNDLDLRTVKDKGSVSVDIDMSQGRCFGNHVTYVQNENVISLNKDIPIGTTKYYSKFAGSTAVTMMSLYDISIDDMTDEQLELLICIDGAYKQYFFNSAIFTKYYRDILEYPRFIDIVSKRDEQYFKDIIAKYNLSDKIYVQANGYLDTSIKLDEVSKILGIDLQLPTINFNEFTKFQTLAKPIGYFNKHIKKENIFSSAVTSKDFCVATLI